MYDYAPGGREAANHADSGIDAKRKAFDKTISVIAPAPYSVDVHFPLVIGNNSSKIERRSIGISQEWDELWLYQ